MYLQRPDIAQIVVGSIHKGEELGHYELNAYVVMGNHVHLPIEPAIAPDRLLKSLKRATARYANSLLGRTGTGWGTGVNSRRSERISKTIR